MSEESYANYEPYLTQPAQDFILPRPFGRGPRYTMVEINGQPTQIPVYTAEDYHLPDTETNSPVPGESPEETERRKAEQLMRSRLSRSPAKRSSLSSHEFSQPSRGASPPALYHQGTTMMPKTHFAYGAPAAHYSPMSTQELSRNPYPNQTILSHRSRWSQHPQAFRPAAPSLQPFLTIDTGMQVPHDSQECQTSSSYPSSEPWHSADPESYKQEFPFGDGSVPPPDTPVDSLASPPDYLPPPSAPVNLLSLPPQEIGVKSSPESPQRDGKRTSQGGYEQLMNFRRIHPKSDEPAHSPLQDNLHALPMPPADKSMLNSRAARPKVTRMACKFCRGRKIACGAPPPGGDGHTCNQCLRRALTCVYPEETHRGSRHRRQGSSPSQEAATKPGRPPRPVSEPRLPGENEPMVMAAPPSPEDPLASGTSEAL